jgi:pimeloyl-ACP methyl ester carboxylesterase
MKNILKKIIISSSLILLYLKIYSQPLCDHNDVSPSINISVNVNGKVITGEYAIWYKCFPTNDPIKYSLDNKITKAFVICEGLDPGNKNQLKNIYRNTDGNSFREKDGKNIDETDMPIEYNMLTELRKRGYDIICLNLFDNWSPIQENAMLFRKLLQEVQAQLNANGSKHQITAGGWSMGGLVSRYAITYMEHIGENHRVENFITFDSPHRGANVPLGAMHLGTALDQILSLSSNIFSDEKDPIKKLARNLKNPDGIIGQALEGREAPKQMLAMYGINNFSRRNLLDDFNTIGNYPHKTRNFAFASGASGINRYGTTTDGGRFLEWTPGLCLIDRVVSMPFGMDDMEVKYCPYAAHLQLNAMPGDIIGRVFQASIGQQASINGTNLLYDPLTSFAFMHDNLNDPGNLNPKLDIVPGAYFPTDNIKEIAHDLNTKTKEIDLSWRPDWGNPLCVLDNILGDWACVNIGWDWVVELPIYEITGRMVSDYDFGFTFMPTLSALAVSGNDWYRDVKQIPGYPYIRDKNITPFDVIMPSSNNLQHVDFSHDVRTFLVGEIAPSHMYIQNRVFPPGYVNHFEAKNITIDNNSDPVPNRNLQGDVVFMPGCDVTFTTPPGGQIHIGSNGKGVHISSAAEVRIGQGASQNNITYTPTPQFFRSEPPEENLLASNNTTQLPQQQSPLKNPPPVTYQLKVGGMGKKSNNANSLKKTESLSLIVSPNPTQLDWNIQVTSKADDVVNINLYNSAGTLVYESKSIVISANNDYSFRIDTKELNVGLYILKITGNAQVISEKLLLVK